MRIGEVARGAGVSTKTVRYDESHVELVREIHSRRRTLAELTASDFAFSRKEEH